MNDLDAVAVEKQSHKNIRGGVVLGYVALLVNVAYGLFFTPWIISSIGKSVYGVYTIVNTLISIFLVDFGLSTTTNVFLSKYRAEGKLDEAHRFSSIVLKIYLILDALVFAAFSVAYFLIPYIYQGLSSEEIVLLKNSFLIVASFSLLSFPSSLFTGILQSYEKFIALKIIDIASKLLVILFTFIALKIGWGLYGVVASHALSGVLAIMARLILTLRSPVKPSFKQKITKDLVKPIIKFSLYTALASFGSRLVFVTIPTILGIVSNSDEVAVFGVVSTLESYVYLFSTVTSGLFVPKVMREKEKSSDPKELEKMAIRIGKIQFFVVGLIFAGFASCGNEFLSLWMGGEDFKSAYFGLLLVIVYQLFFVPQLIYDTALVSDQRGIKWLSVFYVIRGLIVSSLAFALGWLWGAFGACLSICLVRLAGIPFEWFLYRKFLKISALNFYKNVYVRALPAFGLSIAVGLLLHFFLPLSDLYKFIVIGCAVVAIFSLLFFLFLPSPQKTLLISMFKNKFCKCRLNTVEKRNAQKIEGFVVKTLVGAFCLGICAYCAFLAVDRFAPNMGICGTYYCYATIEDSSNRTLIEALTVASNNRCERIYFVKNGEKLDEPQKNTCKWKLRHSNKNKFNQENQVEMRSDYVFSFETEEGVSFYQFYYSAEENAFYDKQNSKTYGGGQLKYVKEMDA